MRLKTSLLFFYALFLSFLPAMVAQEAPATDTLPSALLPEDRHRPNLIEREQFNQGLMLQPLDLIQGRLPSLMTFKTGSNPTGQYDFRIRGVKSFGVNRPLVVVDGVPLNGMETLHPSDIASIEVLADGGSSNWYGARGGNGVLMIKTKKGVAGPAQINYQVLRSSDRLARAPQIMDADTYREAGLSSILNNIDGETDWWGEITRRRAQSLVHNLSISGGNQQTTYYVSLGFDDVEGIAEYSEMDRLNARLNLEHKAFKDRLNLQFTMNSNQRTGSGIENEAFAQATRFDPTKPIRTDDPTFGQYGGYYERPIFGNYNPVSITEQIDLDQKLNALYSQFQVSYNLLPWLKLGWTYALHDEEGQNHYFSTKSSYYAQWYNGRAQSQLSNRKNRYTAGFLQLDQHTEDWDFSFLAQAYDQRLENDFINLQVKDFLTDAFSYHNLGAAQSTALGDSDISSGKSVRTNRSFSGHLNLAYRQRFGVN
ncbi:MAG: TonB-dependent receptor plug domain-containing protein, partial [Bacteroidota bacterium]